MVIPKNLLQSGSVRWNSIPTRKLCQQEKSKVERNECKIQNE